MCLVQFINERKGSDWQNAKRSISSRANWYHKSYPLYVNYFKENRTGLHAFIIRTALVGSWVPTIVYPELNRGKIEEYRKLIKPYIDNRTSPIFVINGFEKELKILCSKCDGLINSNSKQDNISTVSKYLHFENPYLFPILDTNIMGILYKQKHRPNFNNYLKYVREITELTDNTKLWNRIVKISKKIDISPLRYLDTLVFNQNDKDVRE